MIVHPAHQRRQRHQDRFDPARRLEAEDRAAVVDQVELHVAAAAILLPGSLPLAVRQILPPPEDRQVRRQEAVAGIADEGEDAVEIVEEDAADAAGLLAMRQVEILVAPLLELRMIDRGRMPGADVLPDAMEVDHVLAERIVRRQVRAAAEPLLVSLRQEAKVGMHRRHHRILRMQHQRHARGDEPPTLARHMRCELGRHFAVDQRPVDAGLLEDAAVGEDARPAAAAAGAVPGVFAKRLAVDLGDAGADAVLQIAEIGGCGVEIGHRGYLLLTASRAFSQNGSDATSSVSFARWSMKTTDQIIGSNSATSPPGVAVPNEHESTLSIESRAVIESLMTGLPVDPAIAERIHEKARKIRERILKEQGLLDIAVPGVRDFRGERLSS